MTTFSTTGDFPQPGTPKSENRVSGFGNRRLEIEGWTLEPGTRGPKPETRCFWRGRCSPSFRVTTVSTTGATLESEVARLTFADAVFDIWLSLTDLAGVDDFDVWLLLTGARRGALPRC